MLWIVVCLTCVFVPLRRSGLWRQTPASSWPCTEKWVKKWNVTLSGIPVGSINKYRRTAHNKARKENPLNHVCITMSTTSCETWCYCLGGSDIWSGWGWGLFRQMTECAFWVRPVDAGVCLLHCIHTACLLMCPLGIGRRSGRQVHFLFLMCCKKMFYTCEQWNRFWCVEMFIGLIWFHESSFKWLWSSPMLKLRMCVCFCAGYVCVPACVRFSLSTFTSGFEAFTLPYIFHHTIIYMAFCGY